MGANFRQVELAQGTVRYQDVGDGPAIVFVHGLLVNGALWNDVVSLLAASYRCIVPTLPLGSHSVAMRPHADLTPPGVAHLVADFIAALDLHDATLVGNDTGGAICQILIAHRPERIARLVLTNCDAFEAFLPLPIRPFQWGPQFFGTRFTDALAFLLRSRAAQRLLLATVSRRRADTATLDAFFTPLLTDRAVRRDVTQFLRSISSRYTIEAAQTFDRFDRPVLLVWGKNDLFFLPSLARRLQGAFPDARLEWVGPSRAFVPLDQPERLARHIEAFVRETTARSVAV